MPYIIADEDKLVPHEPVTLTLESPEVVESAKKSIALAVKTISSDPDILGILKHKFRPGSNYVRHISLLSMVSCCLCQQLGWTSESSQLKLAIAALMHDLALDDEVYLNVDHWNACAKNSKALDPDSLKYRSHPVEAVGYEFCFYNCGRPGQLYKR
ncbi:MAG TPA: hypothetical protein VNJ08_12490 [Bacteriovoracaceae bacterium]|nr:hypothetical protein [Bacteriovoracaceae bacterium]